MKPLRFALSIATLGIVTMGAANLRGVPAHQAEVQTVTITTSLESATGAELGDLIASFKAGKLSGVDLKKGRRHRMFAIVDRTQLSGVACEAKDAEYGNVRTRDGSWIAVVMCPQTSRPMPIRVPELVRARAGDQDDAAAMDCWENKELRMGVCFKVGTQPVMQTREHILLARQVGVPH
jgi:hypothetical protein